MNPYTDRMNEVARLRGQLRVIQNQISMEIAKAWRLSPAGDLASFAATLGQGVVETRTILWDQGIPVRLPEPAQDD